MKYWKYEIRTNGELKDGGNLCSLVFKSKSSAFIYGKQRLYLYGKNAEIFIVEIGG